MKKTSRAILTAILSVLFVVCVFFTGCTGNKSFTLTFNVNGGTEISAVTLQSGEEYTLPVPEKEGYSFEGWFKDETFVGQKVTSVVADSSFTLYAKWEKLCTVNLDANGGTLSVSKVYLKSGSNVYDGVKDLVPTKTGYVFGAWFNGANELAKSLKITDTETPLSLKAGYKVGYTVEIYKQKTTLDGYDLESKTEYDYVGATCNSYDTFTGFTENVKTETVSEITLKDNASENVIKRWFDRRSYTVMFNDDSLFEERTVSETFVYGAETEIPYVDFELTGMILCGWADSYDGEILYNANLGTELFNVAGEYAIQPGKITVTKNL
ncbi:MAG: InlB B-repeat-containing protein, partial [Clostridia bacterium]|nr:InlB B-repeat-containing protein [Clostridia bacterium]